MTSWMGAFQGGHVTVKDLTKCMWFSDSKLQLCTVDCLRVASEFPCEVKLK